MTTNDAPSGTSAFVARVSFHDLVRALDPSFHQKGGCLAGIDPFGFSIAYT